MKVNIRISESWNDLNALQLREVANSLEWYHRKKKEAVHPPMYLYGKLYLSLIKQLLRTNNPFKVWFALRQILPPDYEQYVKFLTGEIERTLFLPKLSINNTYYHPPASRLQNLKIKEFSFVDSLYYNWRKSTDDRYLDLLCATLYRRGSFKHLMGSTPLNENDIRKPFDKLLIEQELQHFKKLDHKTKLAIAYTYEGCRNYIVKQYPHVFPKPPKPEEGEKIKNTPAAYVPFGKLLHFKIQFDISKVEAAQNLNIHDFFGPYENELIEQKHNRK